VVALRFISKKNFLNFKMATFTTIHDLQSRQEFEGNVLRLQAEAENEFEQKVLYHSNYLEYICIKLIYLTMNILLLKAEEIKEEVSNLDEDEIEQFVRNKFNNLNTLFLKRSKELEDYVIKKKPKKPVKLPEETTEEYKKRQKGKPSFR
jgi:hypothetical protein